MMIACSFYWLYFCIDKKDIGIDKENIILWKKNTS
jgi:hypothetical protein